MTVRYVGPGGNNSNNGLTWSTRKLTLNGAEDTPVVAGDVVYVGAGTYRELLTVDVSGGNIYSTGTISVTNGSAVVTGAGTSWLANVAANYILHVTKLASGTDGVTIGLTATSHTFTSAAGNFQAGHVGQTIRINTIGAFIVTAVTSATEITVAKPDNSSFLMGAGITLTYDVGPESPCDILSVDSNTQITLTKPWSAASFTGLAYLTYNPIRYIGDYTGANTDGVGGVVRITGSDNDQTATRAQCINATTTRNYRIWQGFQLDTVTGSPINHSGGTNWIIDDSLIYPSSAASSGISIAAATQGSITVRNCFIFPHKNTNGILFSHSSSVDNSGHLIQNTIVIGGSLGGIRADRVGGVTVRNCFVNSENGIRVAVVLTVGQTMTANNNILQSCSTAFLATAAGEITEDFNDLFANTANRTNTLTGANSKTYPALFDSRWFFQLLYAGAGPYNPTQMATPFDLSAASQLINLAGFNPSANDMRGTAIQQSQREWGALEYDPTLSIKARQASSIDGGGMVV